MEFDLSRLRRGELIAGAGGVVLLASVLILPWYGASGPGGSVTVTGWSALSILRWLILLDGLAAVALATAQAACRAPALPVSLSVISTVLGAVTAIALVYRVLINLPGPDSIVAQRLGAFLGLVAAVAIVYGAFASMREEGIPARDGIGEVPTVSPGSPSGS
jgi:hypothetical protein